MARFILVFGLVLLAGAVSAVQAQEGRSAELRPLDDATVTGNLSPYSHLSTVDTCIVRHDAGIFYKIDGWVAGAELYKGYCDPGASCPGAYPFTVTAINMPMWFGGTPTFRASVDVELVDYTDPDCPAPGQLIDLSMEYELSVPQSGLYDIWIPLDTPITVDGPFFAGFYISTNFTALDSAAVLVDSVPTPCVGYNAWDTTIGFVDLCDNQYWNFPGRLVLYAAGIPGGSAEPPSLEMLDPVEGDTLLGSTEIWARERNGSTILEYTVFEYRPAAGGPYTEIGRDYDPVSGERDGVSPAVSGSGLSYVFDPGGLIEGEYILRATVYDTLGRFDSDSVLVYVEPTPPIPSIVSYQSADTFCNLLEIDVVCPDEDLDFVQAFQKQADETYSCGLVPLGPAPAPYWVAPMAAAMAIEVWYERGYTAVMTEYTQKISGDTLAARLLAGVGSGNGTGIRDEDLVNALRQWFDFKRSPLRVDYRRHPDYYDVRAWLENEERTVLLGLGGTPGTWVTVDGYDGWAVSADSLPLLVGDPLTGAIETVAMRSNAGSGEIHYGGAWAPVDLMVSISAPEWTVARQSLGADLDGTDGWSIDWTPSGLVERDRIFVHVTGRDGEGMKGASAKLLEYSCAQSYILGDYNNDGSANIADADYLIQFIALNGASPVGGGGRADANCDGYVNMADVVFFLNYLLREGADPCH